MSDNDVQDVRDFVAVLKKQSDAKQQMMQKMKQLASNPAMGKEDYDFVEQMKAVSLRMQDKKDKEKRIGLRPDESSSSTDS